MSELLQSIKADLLSRRLLPLLALLVVALLAAVAYTATGGSSGSSAPPVNTPGPAAGGASLPVTVAHSNPNEAVSETPGGVRYQNRGPTRDPFIPLPSPPKAQSAGANHASSKSNGSSKSGSGAGTKGSSGNGTGGSSSGGSGSGGGETAPTPVPKKPSKPSFPYVVSIQFGRLSTPTPGQPVTLTPYENLKPQQPLPSKQEARIAFERVTAGGKGAIFKLLTPPILHGTGVCLPSTSECQTIDLEVGHSEELEYVESGNTVVYELKVVSISKRGASAARAKGKTAVVHAHAKA
jgi:hypothetical protein